MSSVISLDLLGRSQKRNKKIKASSKLPFYQFL